jgi:Tol biopolymer transport system component
MPTGVDGVVVKETGAADFDIASNGTLVYVPGSSVDSSRRVMFVTRTGEQTPVPNLEPGNYRSVRVNRDGTEIAFETTQSGHGNLWTYDVARAARNALTTGDADDKNPLWHPTEKRILFGSNRDGRLGLFAVNADGSGAIERLMSDDKATEIFPHSFSRDARTVLFSVYRGSGSTADIGMFALGGGTVDNRMQTAVNEGFPAVSPDGQWLAYASTRTGSAQVYVERYPGLGDRRSISTGVGLAPVWSRSGRELYYFDPSNQQLMAVDITPGANLVASVPKTLFKVAAVQSRTWGTIDVMPDGRFVVIVRNDSDGGTRANPIVMQNWSEELRQRVPVK